MSVRTLPLIVLQLLTMGANCMRPPTMSASASKGKLLVIGGNGFVGSNVLKQLVAKGVPAISISRSGTTPKQLEKTAIADTVPSMGDRATPHKSGSCSASAVSGTCHKICN